MLRSLILVVDDNPEVRDVLAEFLLLEGYPVARSDGGLPALLRIGRENPACVVLDVKLRDISGLDVYRAIRADPDFRELPVLLVSGAYPDERVVSRQLGDETIPFLPKPVGREDLINAVKKLLV